MKKFLHAEMWDKMQYLFRNYYDRMMHCTLYYDGTIDKENFKKALKFQIDNVPVLHSRYHNNFIKPYWVVQDYTIDDVITIKQSKNLEFDVNKFLTQQIDIKNNVQIQVALFECEGKTALCMVSNHMCMDGGDFKYFLSTLCKNYTKLCLNNQNMEIKHGSRSYEVVYSGLSDEDKKIAGTLFKNVSQTKDKHRFPLTAKSPDDTNRIVKHILPKEKFEVMRLAGKAKGHTVNDIMLACYFQSLFELAGYEKDATVTIPCMIDLRRHMKDGGAESGLTNHTGFMTCTIHGIGATVAETLLKVEESIKDEKADKFIGLYSLPLLHLAYQVFPHFFSEFCIKLGYNNPLIGMSNVGIILPETYVLNDLTPYDGFFTGAIKHKPFMQVALTTMNGNVTFTIAVCGTTKDEAIIQKFFTIFDKNVDELIKSNL